MKKSLTALLLLSLAACLKNDFDELEFIEATAKPPDAVSLASIRLVGKIDGLTKSQQVDECGFFWSTDNAQTLQNPAAAQKTSVPPPLGNSDFSMDFSQFGPDGRVFYRAYARLGERLFISENVEYHDRGEIVRLISQPGFLNDSAWAFGLLLGVQGKNLDQHGHVFSASNPDPKIASPDCFFSELGPTNDDGQFVSPMPKLKFNTSYFVRAYATSGGEVFYSKAVQTFKTKGGWQRVADFPMPFQEGAAIGLDFFGKGFMGFGCPLGETECLQEQLPFDFWAFNPSAANGFGKWSALAGFPASDYYYMRTNAALFAFEDSIYLLGGEFYAPFHSQPKVLYRFAASANGPGKWERIYPDPPADLLPRGGPVAFSLNGKCYFGSGEWVDDNQNRRYGNDFWEFDPKTRNWRRMAKLPRKNPNNNFTFDDGRIEASAFVCNNSAYVGAGFSSAAELRDFWKFTPPATSNPQDTGKWEFVGFFPGKGRFKAVAFGIQDKGYLGLGKNNNVGELADFWEFDPATNAWTQKNDFLGGKRFGAAAFSVGGFGYAGTGLRLGIQSDGSAGFDSLADFWRFVPDE